MVSKGLSNQGNFVTITKRWFSGVLGGFLGRWGRNFVHDDHIFIAWAVEFVCKGGLNFYY